MGSRILETFKLNRKKKRFDRYSPLFEGLQSFGQIHRLNAFDLLLYFSSLLFDEIVSKFRLLPSRKVQVFVTNNGPRRRRERGLRRKLVIQI